MLERHRALLAGRRAADRPGGWSWRGGGGAAASFAFEHALPWRRAVCSSSKERLHVRHTPAKWPAVRSYPCASRALRSHPPQMNCPRASISSSSSRS